MHEKILIVEDDPAILTGLIDLLSGEGYTVVSTTRGDEALSLYEKEKQLLLSQLYRQEAICSQQEFSGWNKLV